MNPNLAEENLKTIRTLMERSAVYRRALAPIMLQAGILGLLAAVAGIGFHVNGSRPFAGLWLGTACVAVTLAFLLVRRQALKDKEPFWSPPTFRVGQALLPPLLCGMVLGGVPLLVADDPTVDLPMILVWLMFYGCALHSAGFFMVRGIKWLGWVFIAAGMALMLWIWKFDVYIGSTDPLKLNANTIMGLTFGGLHFIYGIYLYFTEKKTTVA